MEYLLGKDTLRIAWVRTVKVKQPSPWVVPIEADILWFWRKLLQSRDIARSQFLAAIVSGTSVSLCCVLQYLYVMIIGILMVL